MTLDTTWYTFNARQLHNDRHSYNVQYSYNEIQFGYGLKMINFLCNNESKNQHPRFTTQIFNYWQNLGAHT